MIASFPQMVMLLAVSLAAAAGVSAETAGRPERTVPIHFEQRDISQVVEAIARATGRRYLFPDTMRGRVTVTVPGRVSVDEAIALLDATLHVRGFAAIPIGADTTKIVPVSEIQTSAPLIDGETDSEKERPVTTLIRLRHGEANQVVKAMRPMTSPSGMAVAYPPTNSIIFSGTEARVGRLLSISRILDQAADEDIMVRALRYRSADVMSQILAMKFNQSSVMANHIGIWVDERTNQIVIKAPPSKISEVRATVERLDRPIEGEGSVRVVRVVNRDAEEVSEILQKMQDGPAGQSRAAPPAGRPGGLGESLRGRVYSVAADPGTQSLVLTSDQETLSILLDVIGKLDRLPPRIAIDVMVFELARPSNFELGLDYFLPLLEPSSIKDPVVFLSTNASAIRPESGIPTTGVPVAPGANDAFFGRYTREPLQLILDPGDGSDPIPISVPREEVAFRAGDFRAKTNILMRPHILAMSGEEHSIFVGDQIPVPQGASTVSETNFGGLSTRQVIERRDVGLELRVKPTLGAEGRVTIDLTLETSGLQASIAGSVDEVGPSFTQRTLQSTLVLGAGEYAILGASSAASEEVILSGVPFLKDIPFLGFFFRSESRSQIKTDLLVVVEATIMRSPSEDIADTIRRRIAMERAMSRVSDFTGVGEKPFAVLVDSVEGEARARGIAAAFSEDGFETWVTDWRSTRGRRWDVYLTDFETFDAAGRVARSLSEAGWLPEVTLLSPVNPMAGD